MTAYELAEFIETGGENIDRKELANMLRQQADRITELEKVIKDGIKAFGDIQEKQLKNKLGICISAEEYQKTHEGFSTIEKVIAKHEAIPSRKEAIDKAREWLKDYCIEAVFDKTQTKPLSDEEIWELWQEAKKTALSTGNSNPIEVVFARAILRKASEK